MHLQITKTRKYEHNIIHIDDQELPKSKHFCYLGQPFIKTGDWGIYGFAGSQG